MHLYSVAEKTQKVKHDAQQQQQQEKNSRTKYNEDGKKPKLLNN